MVSFLDQNRGFVLKLKIKTAAGQSQIRRVPLPRIVDAKGDISYEELVGLVLIFSQPEGNTTFRDAKRYIVTLTYYDDEKDLITLASTEEFKEAIELFAGQKFLRITTCVKTKTLSDLKPSYRRGTAVPPPAASGGSKSDLKIPPNFANLRKEKVLNTKIVGRNNKGKQPKVFNGIKVDQVTTNIPPCKNSIPRASNTAPNGKNITDSLSNPNETISNRSSFKTKELEETKVDVPFIHGRHTCDGCLTTPIVGKRYHSTNLKDYDLCQKCYDNYKGSAIKYEAVELRRDMAFQNRWRQRHQKAEQMRKLYQSRRDPPRHNVSSQTQEQDHNNSNSHHVGIREQSGQGSVARKDTQTQSKVYNDKPFSTRPISHLPNPAIQNNIPNSNIFDDQLKEAIRRSLDDVVSNKDLNRTSNEMVGVKEDLPKHESLPDDILPQKENNEKSHNSIKAEKDSTDQKCLSDDNVPNKYSTKTNETEDINGDPSNKLDGKEHFTENKSLGHGDCAIQVDIPSSIEIAKQQTADVEMGDLPSNPNKVVEENGNSLNEESIVQEKDHTANDDVDKVSGNEYLRSTDIVDHKNASVELLSSGESVSGKLSSPFELEDVETMQKFMDTDSVNSEKLVSESTGQDLLLKATENRSASPHSKQRSFLNSQDISFTSDAAGNGDVAEAMGKTLDMVAGVISEMLSESDGSGKPYESDNDFKQGELILNSNEFVEKVNEEKFDTDWSVVESIGSNGTTDSEKIGKATEMLGSALFNSDMRNTSEDNGSNLVGSDSSFSIPSSVPTDLGTVHSNAVGQNLEHRWVNELEKLRELGFDSDSICIEILERICSDSCAMETSIDRVVDELLSFKELKDLDTEKYFLPRI